jgi:iron complex outermembrane recepter protein
MQENRVQPTSIMRSRKPIALLIGWLALALTLLPAAESVDGRATGTIEGRVSNAAADEHLERVRLTVEGTTLETFTDADGYYRITNVHAGTAQVRAFYTGLPLLADRVTVAAGQTVQHDIRLSAASVRTAPTRDGTPIRLEEFVVGASREMSGAARAINEQRFAANMKNVVATDEFGDIADGNVAEFLKFLPGVTIGYAGGTARDTSLNGVPAEYVPVTIDGFSLASAVGGGGGGTGRSVGLDQVSINNLSRIEVSFAPTPESQGAALAGSVNMVPRSSFERAKPVFEFRTYVMLRDNAKDWAKTPGPHTPTRKIHPGADFSYVAPVNKRFGYTLSGGFSRQYSGDPMSRHFWRGVIDATNGVAFPHTTPDQPYLASYVLRTGGKDTKRSAFGATVDYKFTRNDRVTFAFQASTFDVLIDRNTLRFDVNRVLAGQFTPTFTLGAAGAGNIRLTTAGNARGNWTYMPSIIWRHDGPRWKGEAGAAFSRAGNRQRDMGAGFFSATVANRSNVTVSFDSIVFLRPTTVTVTDGTTGALVNAFSLDSYMVSTAGGTFRATDDTQHTTYASMRRDFFGTVPLTLKSGVDFRQGVRDQRGITPAFTYVGRDGRASTVPSGNDDSAGPFLAPSNVEPYGFPAFDGVSAQKLYQHYLTNPTYFTSNANTIYRSEIDLSKRAQELVSSAYVRGDLHFFERRLKLVGGVRAEQTNIEAEGPLTDPTRNFQRNAQGAPILGANGRPLLITTDALRTSQLTFLARESRVEKAYLRLFPSLNASFNVRENLIARAAVYNSIGRPDFNQYAGTVSLPDTGTVPAATNRIVVNNVGIKPWSARTFNARLEYYFEGVGQLSVGAFRRDFENFFGATVFRATPEFLTLYNLDPATYGDFDVATQHNIADTVRTQGLSIDYKQALTFLPSWARGVQVFANASAQRLLGPAATNLAGFVPRTANWGISLSRPRYNLRANWNYIGRQRSDKIEGASIGPGTFTWISKRLYLDLNGEYTFWKCFAVFANLRNVTDAPDDVEIYGPTTPAQARFRERIEFGSLWTLGIKGSF